MTERSFQKKEVWEDDVYAIDASEPIIPDVNSSTIVVIEPPSVEEIKEEIKKQEEPHNIFVTGNLDDGDPEMATDSVTMSELDEINPPDAISYEPKFFSAAHEFVQVVVDQGSVPKRGRAFTEYLQTCFVCVRAASQPEFE